MVVFQMADLLAEAERDGDFQLHLRPVLRIPAPALRLPEGGHGEGVVPHQLLNILADAVFIAEFLGLELTPHLVAEPEGYSRIHHRLAAQHIPVIFHGNTDVGEHLFVRPPAKAGAGFLPVGGLLFQAADVPALFKVKVVPVSVPADGGVKVFRGVLGGTGTQAVQAQGVLVVLPVFPVLAAGVHLAEHQFPIVALFLLVVVHGAATSEVLHLHAQILVAGDDDGVAVALPGLVDCVGEDFKHRVLAALQVVGAEDHRRALAHPVFPLEHGDAGISVLFLLFRSHFPYLPWLSIIFRFYYTHFPR